jgi:isoleucyl-tRNA synthetase
MTDYKDTLNLPHTDFPMKADLAQREPELLKRWEQAELYQQLRKQRKGKQQFILHDGPPYANGNTHIGHAVNKVLKDIIVKSKSLSGLDAPYVPGWDCHGLPIELNVEKKYGKAGEKLSPKEFRAKCREYAQEQINIQREEFKRLGIIGDWNAPYRTMDFKFEADIIRALAKIIANGHLQQGFKPVHWCIDCGSALAEAEVEYADKTSPAIDVKFRVVNKNDFLARLGINITAAQEHIPMSIPIWTTTPWTLPANEAVSLHPEIAYDLVEVNINEQPEYLLIANVLLQASLARYGIAEFKPIAKCVGADIEHILLQHPFYDRQVPVILGEHVTTDSGTGAVHTAPAHGQEDYAVGQRYKLPMVNPVGSNGCYLPDVPLFAGQHVFKANANIIDVLKQHHNLLCDKKLEHSYPHCWRHKIPLIFRATPQWFISMDQQGLRAQAMQAIDKVQWIPERGKARISSMVEQRPDWCISRQRIWCSPITLFVHNETDELHPDTMQIMEKVAELVEQKGIDAWDELNPVDLLGNDAKNYRKITDTLDVWFDSGVTHYAVLKQNPALAWPADLYLEGSDQHRGWFQSSLLTAIAMYDAAPYKAVLTHGFTVDEKGRKMSKSLGNVIAPEKVINSLGADILRLWISSTDYRNEIAVSDEILKRSAEAYRRIRNTMRFLLANMHDFDPAQHAVPFNEMLSLDKWIVLRARALQEEIKQAYDDYQFHLIYHKLHNFCIVELGGFYLDIIKDRQYTMQKNSRGRRSAQTALAHIAEAMVRWFAPVLSFTAEEIWGYLPGKRNESVFLNEWYEFPVTAQINEAANYQAWDLLLPSLLTIREAVNKEIERYRSEGLIGANLEAEVDLYFKVNSALYTALTLLGTDINKESELRYVLITSRADIHQTNTVPAETIQVSVKHAEAEQELWIKVTPSQHAKCTRCWHRRADVGTHAEHPEICGRCVENVSGNGEVRFYA